MGAIYNSPSWTRDLKSWFDSVPGWRPFSPLQSIWGQRFRGTTVWTDWCEVSPNGHQNNGAPPLRSIAFACIHGKAGRCLLYCCNHLTQSPSSIKPCAPSERSVVFLPTLPIIGLVNASSFDVVLPIWFNSIRLVPLLGRRICFGDRCRTWAGSSYFSRCRGRSMRGFILSFMLSSVPDATTAEFALVISFVSPS